jgi:hypothetical protein
MEEESKLYLQKLLKFLEELKRISIITTLGFKGNKIEIEVGLLKSKCT